MKLSKSLISIWVPMIFESRYCLTNGPNVQKRSNIIVQFTSDDSITRTGAQCTISCIEDSPSPPPSPLCMFGYDSVCFIKQVYWSKKCLLSFCGRYHIEYARWRIFNSRTWHPKMKLNALVCQLKLLKIAWKRASVLMGLCLRSVFKWMQSTSLAIKLLIVRQLQYWLHSNRIL